MSGRYSYWTPYSHRSTAFRDPLWSHYKPSPTLQGHGPPEGSVPGVIGQKYIDCDSLDLYLKIRGEQTLGWELVGKVCVKEVCNEAQRATVLCPNHYNVGTLADYFWFQIDSNGAVVNDPFPAIGIGSVPVDAGGAEWLLAKSFTDAGNFWATDPFVYVGEPVLDYWNGKANAAWANGSGTYYVATGLVPPLDLTAQLFSADPAGPDQGFPGAYGTVATVISESVGSATKTVPAGAICVTLVNPVQAQIDAALADLNAQALAQAQDEADAAIITITSAEPPDPEIGVPYSFQFTATGGTGPYTWTKTGTLPTGLSLTSSGLLSGTPTESGTFDFTVTPHGTGTGCAVEYELVIPEGDNDVVVENEQQCATTTCTHTVYSSIAVFRLCDDEGTLYQVFDPDTFEGSPLNADLDSDGSLGSPFDLKTKGTYALNGTIWCLAGSFTSEVSQDDADTQARSAVFDRGVYENLWSGKIIACGAEPTPCAGGTVTSFNDVNWKQIYESGTPPITPNGSQGLTMTGGNGTWNLTFPPGGPAPFGILLTFGRGAGAGYYEPYSLAWNTDDLCFDAETTIDITVTGSGGLFEAAVTAAIQYPSTNDTQIIYSNDQIGTGTKSFSFTVPTTTALAFELMIGINAEGSNGGTITIVAS